jgi:hypothetical protein
MSDYEKTSLGMQKLSLTLLSQMATGISLLLSKQVPVESAARASHDEMLKRWQASLTSTLEKVTAVTSLDADGKPSELPTFF